MSSFASILNSVGSGTAVKDAAGTKTNQQSQQRLAQPTPQRPLAQPVSKLEPKPSLVANSVNSLNLKRKHDAISTSPRPQQTAPRPQMPARPQLSNGQSNLPTAAATTAPTNARPPPKGSYREVMMRAEAAKAAAQNFGQIKHKAMEKPRREKRSQTPETATAKGSARSTGKLPTTPQRQGSQNNIRGTEPTRSSSSVIKLKRKPLELEYKGTMRPKSTEPQQKSLARPPAEPGKRPDRSTTSAKPGQSRYRHVSDEYSDEEELSGDESEGMEGGGFDELMAEEEQSLRAARREDEAAMREEDEHRRRKAERKRAMERLQEARRTRR